MRGQIGRPTIGFHLDDSTDPEPLLVVPDQVGAEQGPGRRDLVTGQQAPREGPPGDLARSGRVDQLPARGKNAWIVSGMRKPVRPMKAGMSVSRKA